MTDTDPPKGEKHHTAEDSFAPAGTPVYAIGDGIISYSGKARGYGWLIIIDHPVENVYSLYGHLSTSRWKKSSGKVKKGELPVEKINEEVFEKFLYTAHMPKSDPDLIIRTSGEERLSGFLLWQSAYSELCFLDVFWPDFRRIDLLRAVRTYQQRKRRFGT